jgi:DNA-binding transcriptional MerR regulator
VVAEHLLISDVTALTGITAGRIRHYEKLGLLRTNYLDNGYRVFGVDALLDLLRIDLLRSLGVGIQRISALLHDQDTTLLDVLREQRARLVGERERLDRLLAAIDTAIGTELHSTEDDSDASERTLRQLATSHRDSIGVVGRLSSPLSTTATAMYAEFFASMKFQVPPLFGQMLLPPAASTLLEELAATPGGAVLFDRFRSLGPRLFALGGDDRAAAELARSWVDQQLDDPLPADVAVAVWRVHAGLEHDPIVTQGFKAWATSISPGAVRFLDAVAEETARRGAVAVSVIVVPAPPP